MEIHNLTDQFIAKALKRGSTLKVRVQGICMEPAIKSGSLVKIERLKALSVGSVVLYRDPAGRYLAHRIVGTSSKSVITCGDRNNLVDKPIRRCSIIGVVRAVPERVDPTHSVPQISVYLSPDVDSASMDSVIPDGIYLNEATDISGLLERLRAADYYTVLLNGASRHDFRVVPSDVTKIAAFIGFKVANYSSFDRLVIGVNDVDLVARIKADWWSSCTLDETLNYLKGFQDGRAVTECHGL